MGPDYQWDAPLCIPVGITQGCLWGTTSWPHPGRCLLSPGVDRAHDEGEALLNKQLRKGRNDAKGAVVTDIRGCVNETLLRLGTGGGNVSPGRAVSSTGVNGAAEWLGWCSFVVSVVWFGSLFLL